MIKVRYEVDTGAEISFLPEISKGRLYKSVFNLQAENGKPLAIYGHFLSGIIGYRLEIESWRVVALFQTGKMSRNIYYSEKYYDDIYEYRHVHLPKDLAKQVPKNHLMSEMEWRKLGIQQSAGWVHYMIHEPEPHIILFRRSRTDIQQPTSSAANKTESGQVPMHA